MEYDAVMRTAQSLLAVLAASFALPAPARAEFDYRSIFVDRFDYSFSQSVIDGIMENAANQGFKHVIFQVRGRGDAYYNSNFEPRANNLPANFDPLQTAIDAAHSRGLKLHAWINATPMWQNAGAPPAGHIYYNDNPSFRLMDINGNLEPYTAPWSNYTSVNPVLPEVHAHINNVVNDIATNYQVDGVHLDYIRYIPGANNAAANFARMPHDPISHQMFMDATGLDASLQSNFSAYKTYVTGRITDLVASIKGTVDAAEVATGRTMELTASVWRDPDVGKNDYMQDYRTWLEQDLLDVAMPMIYLSASNDATFFNANLANTLAIQTNAKIAPNLASYMHVNPGGGGVALTLSQMQRAYDGFGNGGTDGVGFYDYPAFFNGYSAADRQAIRDFFANIDDPPPPPPSGPGNVLDNFEVDEGHFSWPYNTSPVSQVFGLSAATTIDRVTTEHQGAGVGSQLLSLVSDGSANWQVRHNSGIGAGQAAQPPGNVPLATNGWVGFWLKTDDAGITVRLGIDDPVGNTALERGSLQNVIADNQWHLYQWNFDDNAHWDAFAGGANGAIDNTTVTIDSIWLAGSGDAQIYLDTVSHNPDGMLAALVIPGDFNRDGSVGADDLGYWRTGFGMTTGATATDGDADADGDVDSHDYLVWQRQLGATAPPAPSAAAVPEPSAGALAAILLLLALREHRALRRARE